MVNGTDDEFKEVRMGRPPMPYTSEVGDEICSLISTTVKSTGKILKENEHLPSMVTVFRWLRENEDFRVMYTRAKEEQADLMVDQTLDIADTQQLGVKIEESALGTKIMTADMIEHRKLRIDTRKWVAAKLRPKKYGDKLTLDGGLSNTNINTDVDSLTDAELERIARAGLPADPDDDGWRAPPPMRSTVAHSGMVPEPGDEVSPAEGLPEVPEEPK